MADTKRAALWPALFLLPVLVLAVVLPAAGQGGEHRAGLVVRYGDGRVQTMCVSFAEPTITGEQALALSGLKTIVNPSGAFGGAVCSIDGAGCDYPAKDCFCQCTGTRCEYWAYYHRVNDAWQYSQVGAAAYEVRDGAVEGWSWGPGNFSSEGTEPPQVSFAEICKAGAGQAPAAARPGGPSNLIQYAGFAGVLAVVLAAGVIVLRRRRAE